MRYIYFLFVIGCLSCSIVGAQTPDSSIMEWAGKVHDQLERRNPPHMQLTTDKAIYVPRETVWFRAYERWAMPVDTQTRVLFAFLTDGYRHHPVWSGRFVMRQGLTAGSFMIPDSLADGTYTLVAYAERLLRGMPEAVVYRTIHIRSMRPLQLSILPFDDHPVRKPDSMLCKYLVTGQTGIVTNAVVQYYLYADARLRDSGNVWTNKAGEINLSIKTPDAATDLAILLHVKKDTLSRTAIFNLPVNKEAAAPSIAAYDDLSAGTVDVTLANLRSGEPYLVAAFNKDMAALQDSFLVVRRSGVLHLDRQRLQPGDCRLELYDKDARRIAVTELKVSARRPVVEIRCDTSVYGDRSLVKVRVRCLTDSGRAARGALSLKCVYKKRLSELQSSRYVDSTITIPEQLTSPGFGGTVTSTRKKDPRDPGVLVTGGNGWANFQTDTTGRFWLHPDLMVAGEEKKIMVAVAEKGAENYTLTVAEPEREVNRLLAGLYYPVSDPLPGGLSQDFSAQELAQWRGMLKAVVVKARRVDNYAMSSYIDKDCSGWVCSCNHWLCDGCAPRKQPVFGETYYFKTTQSYFVYQGCDPPKPASYIKMVDPIVVSKPFPVFDPQNSPGRDLYTTLYWNASLDLDANGEASVQFYTNDLKGRFAVIAEGQLEGVEASGTTTFDVK